MEFLSWLICLVIACVTVCVACEFIELRYTVEISNAIRCIIAVLLLRLMRI